MSRIQLNFKNQHKTLSRSELKNFADKLSSYLLKNTQLHVNIKVNFVKQNDCSIIGTEQKYFWHKHVQNIINIKIYEDVSLIDLTIRIREVLNIKKQKMFQKIPDIFPDEETNFPKLKFDKCFHHIGEVVFEDNDLYEILFNEIPLENKNNLFILLIQIMFNRLNELRLINEEDLKREEKINTDLTIKGRLNTNLEELKSLEDLYENDNKILDGKLARSIFIFNSDINKDLLSKCKSIKDDTINELVKIWNEKLSEIKNIEDINKKISQVSDFEHELYERYLFLVKENDNNIKQIQANQFRITNNLVYDFPSKAEQIAQLLLLNITFFIFGLKNDIIPFVINDLYKGKFNLNSEINEIDKISDKIDTLQRLDKILCSGLPELRQIFIKRTNDVIIYGNSGTGKTYLSSSDPDVKTINKLTEMYPIILENNIGFIARLVNYIIVTFQLKRQYENQGFIGKPPIPTFNQNIIFIDEFNRNSKNEFLHDLMLFDRDKFGFSKPMKYLIEKELLDLILTEKFKKMRYLIENYHKIYGELFKIFLIKSLNEIIPEKTETRLLINNIANYLLGDNIDPNKVYIFSTPNITYKFAVNLADISVSGLDLMFNRRVSFQYIPYEPNEVQKHYKVSINNKEEQINWLIIQKALNKVIRDNCHESKCLGYYFWTQENISFSEFKSKIIYHIYNSVLTNTNSVNFKYNIKDSNTKKFFIDSSYENLSKAESIDEIFSKEIIDEIKGIKDEEYKFSLKKE